MGACGSNEKAQEAAAKLAEQGGAIDLLHTYTGKSRRDDPDFAGFTRPIKIVLIGGGANGKSSLWAKMANQPVNFEDYNIVVESKVANIKVGFPWKADGTASHQVEVQLVDAGETLDLEEIEAKKEILEGTDCFMVCVDLSGNPQGGPLENVTDIWEKFAEHYRAGWILVGTKSDMVPAFGRLQSMSQVDRLRQIQSDMQAKAQSSEGVSILDAQGDNPDTCIMPAAWSVFVSAQGQPTRDDPMGNQKLLKSAVTSAKAGTGIDAALNQALQVGTGKMNLSHRSQVGFGGGLMINGQTYWGGAYDTEAWLEECQAACSRSC